MRCKKHRADASSSVGVCATCLRERLFDLIAAQARQIPANSRAAAVDDFLAKSDLPPPLVFPRSVSPYVSRRKSDARDAWPSPCSFFTTPMVAPSTTAAACFTKSRSLKKKKSGFARFSNLFRSKTEKFDSDSKEPSSSSSSSSYSWLSKIFSSRRRKEPTTCYIEDVIARDRRRRRTVNRGMSPESEPDADCEPHPSTNASPWICKRTPAEMRRGRGGGSVRNSSGLAIFLSPLVRASPNRQHNTAQKSNDIVAYSSQSSSRHGHNNRRLKAAGPSLCPNRSRKMVDFGGSNRNR